MDRRQAISTLFGATVAAAIGSSASALDLSFASLTSRPTSKRAIITSVKGSKTGNITLHWGKKRLGALGRYVRPLNTIKVNGVAFNIDSPKDVKIQNRRQGGYADDMETVIERILQLGSAARREQRNINKIRIHKDHVLNFKVGKENYGHMDVDYDDPRDGSKNRHTYRRLRLDIDIDSITPSNGGGSIRNVLQDIAEAAIKGKI